jgi:PAS domain S-box-containing protein
MESEMTQYDKMTKTELIQELRNKEKLLSSAFEQASSPDDANIVNSPEGFASRERAERDSKKSERGMTILNEIANIFLTVPDEEMYGNVTAVVLGATESKLGFFGFISDDGDLVIPSMTRDIWRECLLPEKSITFPRDRWNNSLWGKALREQKTYYSNGPFCLPKGHVQLDHFIAAPIVFGNQTIGLLAVANREGGYTVEDRDLLESITRYVSPILNARLERDRQERNRERAEEALRESELRYKEVFEYTSGCIFLIDVTDNGRFRFAGLNPAEEKAVGLSNAEISGKYVEDALPPELAHQVIANYLRCVEEGTTITYDEELDLPVGRRYFNTVLIPVRNNVGDIYRIIGVARDTTETRQAEGELQRSNDLLRAIIEAAPTAIIGLDLDGKVQTVWNPAAEKMLGWSAPEVMGRHLPSVPMEKEDEFNRFRETMRNGETMDGVEVRRQKRDGTPIDYSIFASPLHDAEGRITGNIAVLVDITEHKRMEAELRLAHDELEKRVTERTAQLNKTAEALRRSEERYTLAVKGANDAIWDMNLVTGDVYHSVRYMNMLGYESNEMADNVSFTECMERIHPDDHQRVMDARDAYLKGRIPVYEVEYRLRHKDGNYRWVASRGACLRDLHGWPYRMAGSLTDITERKKLEQQLLQAQKMESIGILAGGVAHEFNNLLTAISGYGQILQENIPKDDELSRESIEQVLNASDRAAELTRGLLAFSRKQMISPKPVQIDALISNTAWLIQKIIGEDIEFITDFSGKNLMIKADHGQMEQVLMNLATNARDAMPDGGRLTITTRHLKVNEGSEAGYDLPGAGDYALISVTDTGTGIDDKSLKNIFEPFYTTKEVGMGTGLGLSMVHGIVKQHNGSILVDSEFGKGTIFSICLPLIEPCTVSDKLRITTAAAAGTERLLIAEDEEIVRTFMKRILERTGYEVIVADNGEDAVARFKENSGISLVLADLIMPGKNGREMVDEIRKLDPGVKAVFISGYAPDTMYKKGIIEEGMDLITKPFRKDELLRKVRKVLDRD